MNINEFERVTGYEDADLPKRKTEYAAGYDMKPYESGVVMPGETKLIKTGIKARINVGLDIINALTSYYKVNAPVFIDNAEAVTEFVPVNSQTIKLIVDESEPQLVVKEV